MQFTKKTYGRGDAYFAAINVYSDQKTKEVVAVEIPNAGTSGSQFYQPSSRLLKALSQMERMDMSGDVGKGVHIASFANDILTGQRFYVRNADPAHSTSEPGGANRAMTLVHQKLQGEGLGLNPASDLVKQIKEQFRPVFPVAGFKRGAKAAPAPARPHS